MKLSRKIQNRSEYIAFRAAVGILKALPYPMAKEILCGLFDLIGYRIGIRKKVALKQLEKAMPELDERNRHAVLRKHYRMMALNAAEEYLLSADELFAKSYTTGQHHCDEAFALGKGVILGTAHYGNWEAARVFPYFQIPVSVITKKQRNRLFNSYTDAIRSEKGVGIIDMRKGLRDILERLRKNEMVAILADQNAGKHGLIMDFMGYPASHWLGVAKLSLRYKVPIVPGFAFRTEDERTNFCFEKMIYHPELEDIEENYEYILKELDLVLERYIRNHPEQWFWVHKRWKSAYDMFK
ncbi:MAG: lysophospholipid acyltransferase family protein [Candidatus Cloacimonadota bacterium]